MQHLRSAEEYRHLAEAAVCRSQADWLVGMNATRAYTTKYFKKLTVGRVQTPTLAMLVERAGQISNFQKEKYFNVELDCDGIPAVKPKIFDPDEAEQLRSRCHGNEAIVTSVKETEKKVKAPKLYDLTTLQREANRIYGMTAKQTLDTAQSLYEKKLITYPRTDSQYLTEDMEQTARNVVRQIYEKYQLTGPFDQTEQPNVKKVMNNSKVTDHHAIIPTMELASSHLDELKSWEEKILFLIAVHTVMAMSKDHIYQETEIEVECQGEIFKAKGRTVLQDGWKLFENCFKNKDRMAIVDPDQEMKERMPKVTQGQTFYAVAAEKTEHFTSPPKPYSEDTLLAAMETAGNKEFDEDTEKKGLGTPATRAGIIEKLIYSQYATRKGKQILPTDDGKQKWETYETKAEAKRRKKEIEYKKEMGSFVVRKCKTLDELITEYVALYGKENWALSTYEGNVSLINNYILPIIGDTKLSEINTRFIERYYQSLLKRRAVINPLNKTSRNEFVYPQRYIHFHIHHIMGEYSFLIYTGHRNLRFYQWKFCRRP